MSQKKIPDQNPESKALAEELQKQMAERLKNYREDNFKSQGDAVANLDYRAVADNSVYSRYENGKRQMPFLFLKEICLNWNIDPNYLIAGKKSESLPPPPAVLDALEIINRYFNAE